MSPAQPRISGIPGTFHEQAMYSRTPGTSDGPDGPHRLKSRVRVQAGPPMVRAKLRPLYGAAHSWAPWDWGYSSPANVQSHLGPPNSRGHAGPPRVRARWGRLPWASLYGEIDELGSSVALFASRNALRDRHEQRRQSAKVLRNLPESHERIPEESPEREQPQSDCTVRWDSPTLSPRQQIGAVTGPMRYRDSAADSPRSHGDSAADSPRGRGDRWRAL